jgi:glutamate dehydrogenase
MPDIGSGARHRHRALLAESLVARGADTTLALECVTLPELAITPDVAELSRGTERSVIEVAGAFLGVGERFGIDRLVDQLERIPTGDRWSQAAWRGVRDDLDDLRRLGVRLVLAAGSDVDAGEAVAAFLAAHEPAAAEALALIADVERGPEARIDALSVASRAVRRALDEGR